MAEGGGDPGDQGPPGIGVSNLRAYPTGSNSVRLEWTNPDSTNITAFNITYSGTGNAGDTDVGYRDYDPVANSADRVRNANVSYAVTGLAIADGAYTFSVLVVFAEGSGKLGSAVGVLDSRGRPGRIVTLGPNADDDEYADSEDNCRNLPHTNNADTDGDGMGDVCDDDPNNNPNLSNSCTTGTANITISLSSGISASNLVNYLFYRSADTASWSGSNNLLAANPQATSAMVELNCGESYDFLAAIGGIETNLYGFAENVMINSNDQSVTISSFSSGSCPTGVNIDGCGGPGPGDGSTGDRDGDGHDDSVDVDDDGDGLIEISTASELNMTRLDLSGASLAGSSMGCGRTSCDSCIGYELIANIDLAAAGYTNWQPIGGCCGACSDAPEGKFNAIFNGTGYSISNVLIDMPNAANGTGFFGAIAGDAELHNIILINISISSSAGASLSQAGGLVGRVDGSARVSGNSVTANSINGDDEIGGLVGRVDGSARVSDNSVTVNSINGDDEIGGLVGQNFGAIAIGSSAVASNVRGANQVGGLVGLGVAGSIINKSYALTGSLTATGASAQVDGLVGSSNNALSRVAQSYWLSSVSYANGNQRNGSGVTANAGEMKDAGALSGPTSATGIYSTWGDVWCGVVFESVAIDSPLYIDRETAWDSSSARAWNFDDGLEGGDYPALNCVALTPYQQRQLANRALAGQPLIPLPPTP